MVQHTIENLRDFTTLVENTVVNQGLYLFRGQSEDWPLIPVLARGDRTQGTPADTEEWMLDDFKRQSLPYLRITPSNEWDWIALAQHHGLPTRLLDWSRNPLTALWFAVQRPPVGDRDGVLWILEPSWRDVAKEEVMQTLGCDRNWVFAPRSTTERITAQVGWFTVHKIASDEPYFEPLEDSAEFKDDLTKVIIPQGCFADLRFQLGTLGINPFSVFPGLDGLCAHLKWQGYYLADESPSHKYQ